MRPCLVTEAENTLSFFVAGHRQASYSAVLMADFDLGVSYMKN